MDVFFKTVAGVLITVILFLAVSKNSRDISTLITIAGCCAVFVVSIGFFRPVIEFIQKLKGLVGLDNDLVSIILKAVGIGIITEITVMICSDSGNGSLGKSLQILSSGVILWMSIPVFNQLLELLDQILGAI